jgi:hypothetical protein
LWAARKRHEAVKKLLLENGAETTSAASWDLEGEAVSNVPGVVLPALATLADVISTKVVRVHPSSCEVSRCSLPAGATSWLSFRRLFAGRGPSSSLLFASHKCERLHRLMNAATNLLSLLPRATASLLAVPHVVSPFLILTHPTFFDKAALITSSNRDGFPSR